jgi:hypothetical protein
MPAFAFILANWRIIAVVVGVVGLLGGAFAYVEKVKHDAYANGYQKATLEWTIKYNAREAELKQQAADELARQQAANDAAKAEEEAQLEAERKRQMAAIDLAMTLANEAAADPNADNIALDAAAVDRHNRRID